MGNCVRIRADILWYACIANETVHTYRFYNLYKIERKTQEFNITTTIRLCLICNNDTMALHIRNAQYILIYHNITWSDCTSGLTLDYAYLSFYVPIWLYSQASLSSPTTQTVHHRRIDKILIASVASECNTYAVTYGLTYMVPYMAWALVYSTHTYLYCMRSEEYKWRSVNDDDVTDKIVGRHYAVDVFGVVAKPFKTVTVWSAGHRPL